VFKCYKRFDPSYVGEEKVANVAHSYGVDSIWYADSGATDHVTRDLDRLVVRNMYNSTDQIYTASGPCMHIKHIGHSVIHTPSYDLSLINILHVPKSSKNLVSVHRITSNNNVFFELHPNFLLRIGSRGKLFWKANLREDSTLSLATPPLQLHPNMLLGLARSPH
jgi:hypothetical protein